MAAIVPLFPGGVVPQSDRAKEEIRERVAEAERLRERLLDYDHTHETMGMVSDGVGRAEDLMPHSDEVVFDNGGTRIYDEMARNVPVYASLRDGRKDVATGLTMVWLPGVKGDADSEMARSVIEAMWENIDERSISLRALCDGFERGFAWGENVWDEHTRGAAAGFVGIVQIIDRPNDWIGFDYLNRPRFLRDNNRDAPVVDDYKVTFMRCGSLHTRYGRGYGQTAYPVVYAMDAHMKGVSTTAERFSYMPIVITYPNTWKETSRDYLNLKAHISRQWKNWLLLPGPVDKIERDFPDAGAAGTAAGAVINARMQIVSKYEAWLSSYIQGSQYSSGNQAEGSFARDAVASADRLWKAPSDARCIEAMLNRGFVRPTMLVNFPMLPPAKWPRAAIEASFGEDLRLLMELYDQAAKLKIPVSTVTWSETFKIPLAQPGEPVLEAPQQNLLMPPPAKEDPLAAAERAFAEPDQIEIGFTDGRKIIVSPDQCIYTENRGIVRAKFLQQGDVPTFRAVAA